MKKMKALAAALSSLALSPVAGPWLVLASLTIALPAAAAAQQQTPEQAIFQPLPGSVGPGLDGHVLESNDPVNYQQSCRKEDEIFIF